MRLPCLFTASILFAANHFVLLGALPAQEQVLSPEAKRVVDYLLQDWKKQFRSTSIPQAMSNLGIKPSDNLRLEAGTYFRKNTQIANNLQWWGVNNYILSNEEKLLAKSLINTYVNRNKMPEPEEISKRLDISADRLTGLLDFLAKAQLLKPSSSEKLGYSLVEGYERWAGPLRLNFHTVTVEGEKPFDVW